MFTKWQCAINLTTKLVDDNGVVFYLLAKWLLKNAEFTKK